MNEHPHTIHDPPREAVSSAVAHAATKPEEIDLGMNGTVLVIEDDKTTRSIVSRCLTAYGVYVYEADTGRAGMDAAFRLQPDVILLDIGLPDMDGFSVCASLLRDERTMHTPIVFLTAQSDRRKMIQALNLGATDYVTKPFVPEELTARVRVAMRMKRLLDIVSTRSMLDSLTGLWNRAYFDRQLENVVAETGRRRTTAACLMMDLDHFKRVNDTYGHPMGDQVLRQVGAMVQSSCRSDDVVCRYGGEEFALILRNATLEGATTLAERIRGRVERLRFEGKGEPLTVTVSIGVSTVLGAEDVPTAAKSLVSRADQCLYLAKKSGRNRVVTETALLPNAVADADGP